MRWKMGMTVKPNSAGVRFPPPLVYLGALLLGLASERFVSLRSFGIHWRLLAGTGASPKAAIVPVRITSAGTRQ